MATTVYPKITQTTLAGQDALVYDMNTTAPSTTGSRWFNFVPVDGGSRIVTRTISGNSKATGNRLADPFVQVGLYSERVAAQVTVSSNVQVKHYNRAFVTMDPFKVVYRFELTKIAISGMVETPIGQVTEPAVASGELNSQLYTATLPVPNAVTLYPGERLVLRVFLDPAPGQTMVGDPAGVSVGVAWGNLAALQQQISLVFAETITFTANTTSMYARRTSLNGIGNFFDLLPAFTSQTAATAVVNSPGSGTGERQWTRTAGGVNLEFISPRLKDFYYFDAPDPTAAAVFCSFVASESSTNANLAPRFKLFRYRNGTETLIHMNTATAELLTGAAPTVISGYNANNGGANYSVVPTSFQPDDRVILRLYITNVGGNFGAGTATVTYDADGNGVVRLYDLPISGFKAEADPATPPVVTDGLKTLGMGNG